MWNSFQGDRESRLFWLLSESIEKDYKREYVESFLRDYREFLRDYREFLRDYREYFEKIKRDYKERVPNFQRYLDFE